MLYICGEVEKQKEMEVSVLIAVILNGFGVGWLIVEVLKLSRQMGELTGVVNGHTRDIAEIKDELKTKASAADVAEIKEELKTKASAAEVAESKEELKKKAEEIESSPPGHEKSCDCNRTLVYYHSRDSLYYTFGTFKDAERRPDPFGNLSGAHRCFRSDGSGSRSKG